MSESKFVCPWDAALEPAPGAPFKVNLPTAEGEELGRHLARFVDVEIEERRKRGQEIPERCFDCAFRAGSFPNGCVSTVMTAIKCAIEHDEFSCHHGLDADGKPTKACAGWLILEGAE